MDFGAMGMSPLHDPAHVIENASFMIRHLGTDQGDGMRVEKFLKMSKVKLASGREAHFETRSIVSGAIVVLVRSACDATMMPP